MQALPTRGLARMDCSKRSLFSAHRGLYPSWAVPFWRRNQSSAARAPVHAFREWFTSFVAAPEQHQPSRPEQSSASTPALAARAPPRRDFLEARQVSLYQLVDGQEYKFDIPSYQRPYSWRHKQVLEMLQDFLAAYHSRSEYFLGAVVTVKAEDSVHAPMQVIDGQQRLTTLFILLAYAHAWARKQGNEVLEKRLSRMLYIDADPLDPASQGRFRVQLRSGDDAFFKKHLLVNWRPVRYQLAGVAAQAEQQEGQQVYQAAGLSTGAAPAVAGGQEQGNGAPAQPLENETWWRMYDNAGLIQSVLDAEVTAKGLSLQDFLFHTLRNCHVVLMAARDEAASFRIFSTLNGRGMDLSMVDKLKADLLEILGPSQRQAFACAWGHMEDVLGRAAFHRVFDHMLALAGVMNEEVEHLTVLEYFGRKRADPKSVLSIMGSALDYARVLLQLKQCKFEVLPAPTIHAQPSAVQKVQLLSEEPQGGIVTSLDIGGPASPVTSHGAVRLLERQARHMQFFTDDGWVAPTLEFFIQVDDMELRARFLKAAEALQLYLELCGDESIRATRWRPVIRTLLTRSNPSCPDQLAAIYKAIALTPEEKATFKSRLDQKDLATTADRRTLAHLLLRAEGSAVSSSPDLHFPSLHVDRMVPYNPPEGSMWRRSKIGCSSGSASPSSSEGPSSSSGTSSSGHSARRTSPVHLAGQKQGAAHSKTPAAPGSNGAGSKQQQQQASSSSQAAAGAAPPAPGDHTSSTATTSGSHSSVDGGHTSAGSHSVTPHSSGGRGSRMRSSSSPVPRRVTPQALAAGAASGGGGEGGHKYWFEMQRMYWNGKLGNLVLLPLAMPGLSTITNADYDAKAAHYRDCGVLELLPEFSGSLLPEGRFGAWRFSFDECKARHVELLGRLCETFLEPDWEQELLDDYEAAETEGSGPQHSVY